jgi:hypothetical protein
MRWDVLLATLAFVLLGAGLVPVPGHAAIIAEEGFDYSLGELDGQSGGVGFAGSWAAATALTEVADPGTALAYTNGPLDIQGGNRALLLTDDAATAASRGFATSFTSDEVFVRFLFRYSGVLSNNAFTVFWHDDVSTGDHTGRPNLGLKANRGDGSGSEDAVARLALSGSGQVYSTDMLPDVTYLIVGRLHRSVPGSGSNYDRFDLWVNPTGDLSGAPDATASGDGGVSAFDFIGIRTANTAGSSVWIDEMRYADVWLEAVPEPGTAVLVALGLGLLGARRRH